MVHRSALHSALLITATAFGAACSELPTQADPAATAVLRARETGAQLFGSRAVQQQELFGIDAQFAAIAEEIPGFAGMYNDDTGRPVVLMRRGSRQLGTAERSALLQRFDGRTLTGPGAVTSHNADFDFLTLADIRSRTNSLLGIEGVAYTDIDEVANRVAIGVTTAAAEQNVRRALGMLGVDANAVAIRPAVEITRAVSVRDEIRPVVGGLQIWIFFPPGGASLCTLGFNVRSPAAANVHGFVTNSHCTLTMGAVDGAQFNQKQLVLPSEPIAQEVWDLPLFACGTGLVCRFSDAAGVLYNPGVPNEHGRIARTTFPGTTTAGSLDLDPATPHWLITEEKAFPVVNNVLHKTGRTSGWTMGPVVQTCVNVGVSGTTPTIAMLCQDFVASLAQGGDSGSPVFERIGTTSNVRLVGILWGSGTGIFVMSAMQNIRFENVGPANWTTFPGQIPPS